jgi:hypothetical protein
MNEPQPIFSREVIGAIAEALDNAPTVTQIRENLYEIGAQAAGYNRFSELCEANEGIIIAMVNSIIGDAHADYSPAYASTHAHAIDAESADDADSYFDEKDQF